MPNPRDTGRYDSMTDSYINQQVRVDFAWGNIPMQPNDDREEDLDPELDSHIIATSGYQNFPAFTTGGAFDDTTANAVVPNVVALTESAATTALTNAGLVKGAVTTANNAAGATSGNTGKVKTQTPAAGTTVNAGTSVALVKYAYTVPQVTVPNVVDFDSVSAAEAALILEGLVLGTVTTSTEGATSQNDNWVKSQSPAAGTSVAPGSAVNLVEYDYVVAATTGPIAGLNRASGTSFSLNGNDAIMYLVGRTVKPAAGDTITVSGTSGTKWNQTWTVVAVENNDSYNTGGTAVKVTAVDDISFATPDTTSTGGTWTKI